MTLIPLDEVLKEVQEINDLCQALRKGYLKAFPDAPLTERELEYKRLLKMVQNWSKNKE